MKRKPYAPPTIRTLTPDQARKQIAECKNCSEEEADEFLKSLRRQKSQNDQEWSERPTDNKEQEEKKRSA